MSRTQVAEWVQELTEEVFGPHLEIGMVVQHPRTGKTVKITDGRYWGTYGLSNFWYWREVLPDGTLSDVLEQGYWWHVAPEQEA